MPEDITRARRHPPSDGPRCAGLAVPAALVALIVAACTVEPRTDQNALPAAAVASGARAHYREVVRPEGVGGSALFSTAIRAGDLLFLSGQIGAEPGVSPAQLVEGGIESETRQALANVGTVLSAAGLGFDNVVKCTVFLADMADFEAMNSVWATSFPNVPPARSTVATSGLALGARVEIECIAAYPPEG